MVARLPELAAVSREVAVQVTYDAKYAGYVARQQIDIARQQRLAARRIPADFDYQTVPHLRAEAREKLARVRPADLAQAARISGITPADLTRADGSSGRRTMRAADAERIAKCDTAWLWHVSASCSMPQFSRIPPVCHSPCSPMLPARPTLLREKGRSRQSRRKSTANGDGCEQFGL